MNQINKHPMQRHGSQNLTPGEITPVLSKLRTFVTDYRTYETEILIPLERRLEELLALWRRPQYWHKLIDSDGEPAPAPVLRTSIRIKSPSAVVRKIMAKPANFPLGFESDSYRTMTDVVAARAVVYFLSSLPQLDREIRECGWFEISTTRPPHAYMNESTCRELGLEIECRTKPSGYSSIHYILRLKDNTNTCEQGPWFELQLRTLTQDLWAEVEHLLGYKYHTSSPMVRAQLLFIGRLLGTIDDYFDYMARDLSDHRTKEQWDSSSPLTSINLPRLLSAHGISCSQYDIEGTLRMAAACGMKTVSELEDVLTAQNIDRVTTVAQSAFGRKPASSELLPALVLFGRMPEGERDDLLTQWGEFIRMFATNERL